MQVVARLGKEINNPGSVCYWAQRNNIPIFCPALTDGSLGDMIFFHTYKNPGLVIDLVEDIRLINDEALKAAPRKTGMIILGGGAAPNYLPLAKCFNCSAKLPLRPGSLAPILDILYLFLV